MRERVNPTESWLWLLLYPLAWVRIRIPWKRPHSRAWATAKFVASSRRSQRRFEEKYGDLQGFLDALVVADDEEVQT